MLLSCVNDLMDLINRYHQAKSIQEKLQVLAEAINQMGWGRVHVYVFDSDSQDIRSVAYCGLSPKEIEYLRGSHMTYESAQLVIAPRYNKYKVGNAYYFPYGKVDEKIEFIREISSKSSRAAFEFEIMDMLLVLHLLTIQKTAKSQQKKQLSLYINLFNISYKIFKMMIYSHILTNLAISFRVYFLFHQQRYFSSMKMRILLILAHQHQNCLNITVLNSLVIIQKSCFQNQTITNQPPKVVHLTIVLVKKLNLNAKMAKSSGVII